MRRAPLIALLLLAAACRTSAPPPDDGGAVLLPTQLAESPGPERSTAARPSGAPTASGSAQATSTARPTSTVRATPAPPFKTIGSLPDAASDIDSAAPGYADLRSIRVEDNTREARVTVTVAAAVPIRMPQGEQASLGVNVYLPDGRRDGDYQFYALGTEDGWLAYFDTPDGFVDFPGTFTISGSRLVFRVPWSAMKSFSSAGFDAFMDWDREGVVLNTASEDHAPASGRATFKRA